MGKVKETSNAFKGNYFGVLDHNGCLKVAKTEIRQTILHIGKTTVLVMGRKRSYHAEIHKDLYSFMEFVEPGDCAYIKFRRGKAWFVGFQKKKAFESEKIQDRYIDDKGNCDWQSFFEGVDVE